MFRVPNSLRVRTGRLGSSEADGNNGAFQIPHPDLPGLFFHVVASDGLGWEHVSVSLPHRTPTWEEMAYVKSLFWDEEDIVVQFHPPRSEHVNVHPFCLHLWRPTGQDLPRPPSILVGI